MKKLMEEELKTLDDVLEYANESISKHGEQLLSLDELTQCYKTHLKLEKLQKIGITTGTYHRKAKAYFKKRADFISDYDLDNPKYKTHIPEYFPYDNPNTLLIDMKAILTEAGLNSKQITIFFTDSLGAERTPNDADVKSHFNSIFTKYKPNN